CTECSADTESPCAVALRDSGSDGEITTRVLADTWRCRRKGLLHGSRIEVCHQGSSRLSRVLQDWNVYPRQLSTSGTHYGSYLHRSATAGAEVPTVLDS